MGDEENTNPGATTLMGSEIGAEGHLALIYNQIKGLREDVQALTEAIQGRSKLPEAVVKQLGKVAGAVTNPSRGFLVLVALLVLGTGAVSAQQLLSVFGMLPSVSIEQSVPGMPVSTVGVSEPAEVVAPTPEAIKAPSDATEETPDP